MISGRANAAFLVAHALENAAAENQNRLMTILDLPRTDTTDVDVQTVLSIFDNCGAMDAADARRDDLKQQAITALQPLPDGLRARLLEVTEYLTARTV